MRKVSLYRRAFSLVLIVALLCTLIVPTAFAENRSVKY